VTHPLDPLTIPSCFRCAFSGDGRPGPIEKRVGRRLLRLINADSDEGRELLLAGRVDLLGPDGDPLGTRCPREAYALLLARLERRIAAAEAGGMPRGLQDGRDRLRRWSSRILGDLAS